MNWPGKPYAVMFILNGVTSVTESNWLTDKYCNGNVPTAAACVKKLICKVGWLILIPETERKFWFVPPLVYAIRESPAVAVLML